MNGIWDCLGGPDAACRGGTLYKVRTPCEGCLGNGHFTDGPVPGLGIGSGGKPVAWIVEIYATTRKCRRYGHMWRGGLMGTVRSCRLCGRRDFVGSVPDELPGYHLARRFFPV